MAAHEIKEKQGTTVSWKPSGGDHVLTLTNKATATGQKGDVHDWGATYHPCIRIRLITKFAVAPTAGNIVTVYWFSSTDNVTFDGAQAAGDAVLSDLTILGQAEMVGVLGVDDSTNAQSKSWDYRLPSRYGFPAVYNASGQSYTNTAGNHALEVTPQIPEIQA